MAHEAPFERASRESPFDDDPRGPAAAAAAVAQDGLNKPNAFATLYIFAFELGFIVVVIVVASISAAITGVGGNVQSARVGQVAPLPATRRRFLRAPPPPPRTRLAARSRLLPRLRIIPRHLLERQKRRPPRSSSRGTHRGARSPRGRRATDSFPQPKR